MEEVNKVNFSGDKYISYKEYQKTCEELGIEPNEKELNSANESFLVNKLEEYNEYFNNIFTDVGENINLDEEQRRIVLRDDDYCLINAGAGSGKSTTMAAKVKYLVDKLGVKSEEIIMLTFTKKSSEDLDEKVNEALDLGIPVSTFHSLGMKFVQKMYSYPLKVVANDEQNEIICNYIKSLFSQKEKLKDIIEVFGESNEKNYIVKAFVQNYDKFNTFEEYFEDYKKRKYLKEASKPGGIHQYLVNRLSSKESLYTIRGEKVKSLAERRIADFLFINGFEYDYERVFDEKVNDDRVYNPDFTIKYQGRKIYVEYFGLSTCYNTNNELIKREVDKYNRIRKKKEKFQRENNYDFINLDYKTKDGEFIKTLEKELLLRKFQFNRLSDDEIFNRILDNNPKAEFFKFVELIRDFIGIFKNMLPDNDNYMFDKRIKEIRETKHFAYPTYSEDVNIEREKRIKGIMYLQEIYNFYQNYLLENHMIDYDDMINLSYKQIIKDVKEKYPELNYKYVIVDEYQDITFQRFLFVKRLVEYFDAKLISVGDDWQSIYAFAGSRLELFNKFTEMFLDAKDDMYLSTTYRYGQELADITSKFVLENDEQSRKSIRAIKNLEHPIELCTYKPYGEERKVYDLVHEIHKQNPNAKILILARTNGCLYNLKRSIYFNKGVEDILVCNDLPNARIEALTMHRSKGLTADQVIVFGLREKVFPSKGRAEHWIFDYFSLDSISEKMPFAEERRLFYVALTRTKNKVYLVVPENRISKSEFVNELENMM